MWLCLASQLCEYAFENQKKTLFHFGPMSSDILQNNQGYHHSQAGVYGTSLVAMEMQMSGIWPTATALLINTGVKSPSEWTEIGKQRHEQAYKQASDCFHTKNICLFLSGYISTEPHVSYLFILPEQTSPRYNTVKPNAVINTVINDQYTNSLKVRKVNMFVYF